MILPILAVCNYLKSRKAVIFFAYKLFQNSYSHGDIVEDMSTILLFLVSIVHLGKKQYSVLFLVEILYLADLLLLVN